MAGPNRDALELIGFPEVDVLATDDEELTKTYRLFAASLTRLSNDAVHLEPDALDCTVDWRESPPEWLASLKLILALWRPSDEQRRAFWQTAQRWSRTTTPDAQRESDALDFEYFRLRSDALKHYESEGKWLFGPAHKLDQPLYVLDSELMGAPGLTWNARLACEPVNQTWAMVYHVGDLESDAANAIPLPLGFVRREQLVQGTIEVLAHGFRHSGNWGYFNTMGDVPPAGQPLIEMAWRDPRLDDDGDEGASLAPLLAALGPEGRARLAALLEEHSRDDLADRLYGTAEFHGKDAVLTRLNGAASEEAFRRVFHELYCEYRLELDL